MSDIADSSAVVAGDAAPDTTAAHTRRRLLGAAAGAAAAAGAGATLLSGTATAAGDTPDRVLSFAATQEGFGVTFLTEAIRRAPGTPSEQFLPILKAAVTTEFDHVRALRKLGYRPQVDRYWIPEAAFGAGGAGLFKSIEAVEEVEVSLYLVGISAFTKTGNAYRARLCAEALGTEAEHRVLARAAQMMLGAISSPPNDIGFSRYEQRTVGVARAALEKIGIGYGKKNAHTGKFYEYPGDPLTSGVGLPVVSRTPA